MKKISIYEIYDSLSRHGLTDSQYDFSRTWLLAGQSYYSAIKCMGREPGLDTIMTLAVQLGQFAEHLSRSSSYDLSSDIRETHAEIYRIVSALWVQLLDTPVLPAGCRLPRVKPGDK
jgi:hypothetical protein